MFSLNIFIFVHLFSRLRWWCCGWIHWPPPPILSHVLMKIHGMNTPLGTVPLQVTAWTRCHEDLADTTSQYTSEIRTSINDYTWWTSLLNYCQQAFFSAFPCQDKPPVSLQQQGIDCSHPNNWVKAGHVDKGSWETSLEIPALPCQVEPSMASLHVGRITSAAVAASPEAESFGSPTDHMQHLKRHTVQSMQHLYISMSLHFF